MRITFQGAAHEVTGSCHVVETGGRTVLLDCGLFQGRRADVAARNTRLPAPVDRIDAVVLSHAHIDHAGRLPFLVRHGYAGRIHATRATVDLCEVMLADSAHIQEKDAEFLARHGRPHLEPLYGLADAAATQDRFEGHGDGTWFDVVPGVRARFRDAGHILGSASVELEAVEDGGAVRLVFSGDVGRSGQPIIRDPEPAEGAHAVILESTYGDRDHPPPEDAMARLEAVVRETAARGGRVLIPAFAVGRTQEIVVALHELAHGGRIPRIPIVIDSPLAWRATGVFDAHRELFDRSERVVALHDGHAGGLFQFPMVRYTPEVEDSKAAMREPGPKVVIAASGMCESGRILHHLAHGAADPRNTILIVGFQAEHTLGRRIVERRPVLKVFGDEVPLRAAVVVLNGLSAHADRGGLQRWLDAVRAASPALGRVHLVHGEPPAQAALEAQLRAAGYDVSSPAPGTTVSVAPP